MAVVKDPFYSSDARGSVGGITASMARGGNIMKRKAKPTTAYLPGVTRVRSILGWLSRAWGDLTDAQRASWNAWAITHPGTDKFGDPFIMSGFNAYVKLNHIAVWIDGFAARNDLPPEDTPASSSDALIAITSALTVGGVDLSWTELGTGIAADFWEIQVAGPFVSKGRVSVVSMYVFKQSVAGNVLLDTIENLDEGMWYWFRIRYVAADGQVTAWETAQATPKVTV